jgi:hypothetical protein
MSQHNCPRTLKAEAEYCLELWCFFREQAKDSISRSNYLMQKCELDTAQHWYGLWIEFRRLAKEREKVKRPYVKPEITSADSFERYALACTGMNLRAGPRNCGLVKNGTYNGCVSCNNGS